MFEGGRVLRTWQETREDGSVIENYEIEMDNGKVNTCSNVIKSIAAENSKKLDDKRRKYTNDEYQKRVDEFKVAVSIDDKIAALGKLVLFQRDMDVELPKIIL